MARINSKCVSICATCAPGGECLDGFDTKHEQAQADRMDPAYYDGVDRLKSGDELITEERDRQVHELGHTTARDLGLNSNEELERMAIVLLRPGIANLVPGMIPEHWNKAWVKRMINKTMQQRRVIAGALIAAQIDVDNLKYQILVNEQKTDADALRGNKKG
jgi:hypothetical protein